VQFIRCRGVFDEKDVVELKCYDREGEKSKELEGSLTIILKDFFKPGNYQKSFPLTAKTGTAGIIEVELIVDGTSNAQACDS
jgi:hypothetical protein